MNLRLLDTYSFLASENGKYLTKAEKIHKTHKLCKNIYHFDVKFSIKKNIIIDDKEYAVIQVWGRHMKINREKLYKLYMEEINRISDLYEDKSVFEPKEIINTISEIIEKHQEVFEMDDECEIKGNIFEVLDRRTIK